MRNSYGINYKGSKNLLAAQIIARIPPAAVFYDLFAGGCAVSHCAILSGKFGRVVANDQSDIVQLFDAALRGRMNARDLYRFVPRDEFTQRR